MDDFLVCRICLIVDVQMYNLRSSPLDKYFEQLFGVNPHKHELLTQVCAECAALINKCYMFREKCIRGINILQNMLKENDQITKNDLLLLDRDQCKLSSVITLGIPRNHHVYVYSTCPQDQFHMDKAPHVKQEMDDDAGENNNSEDVTYNLQSDNNHLFFCAPYHEVQHQAIEPAAPAVSVRNHSQRNASLSTKTEDEILQNLKAESNKTANKRISSKRKVKDKSVRYIRQKENDKATNRKVAKITTKKKARKDSDRKYYLKKKEKKLTSIIHKTEVEKQSQRIRWRKHSETYRQKRISKRLSFNSSGLAT